MLQRERRGQSGDCQHRCSVASKFIVGQILRCICAYITCIPKDVYEFKQKIQRGPERRGDEKSWMGEWSRGQRGDDENAKMRLEEDLVIRRSRPTMISAKYRAREERRRLLKISAGKLRRIEDPEASLCRSVLINNAVRRLQRENRDEKTRNYGLPVVTYLNDSTKENNVSSNLIVGITDDETSSRKRLSDDTRNDGISPKRQRHDDLDLQDDVFSDFYILPPTPRLLSHIDEIQEPESPHHHHLVYPEDRLGSVDVRSATTIISTSTANTTTNSNSTSTSTNNCCNSIMFSTELDGATSQLTSVIRSSDVGMMEASDVVDPDRICDFARFADSTKTLEERLVELQSLDEHFDLAKFERNNNQSCGRAFHDIQTFHSLVPGLET
ncbi:hypothetical protein HZU73_04722 [Apis mellifera caucasica]|uniref:Uncharacterized protein LOC100576421 isoform X1 n=2 Tax=Apis mellifera TaxID=7460 RepID=A0A7M7IL02_APIME|nr:uncharacterized protein LOC100576421 isoform X1 [Apis mellifera]KAG6799914.1 hypothetical protein HZU73_04722 [Apis mellifera caucasica]KAG9435835.1 hypothetical protein HZU67_02258 [Apis mellifera carnica]|eukprot:XP_016770535.1 uncharacterized protein LOC100576421 isoform X1 [Apis mellifera]